MTALERGDTVHHGPSGEDWILLDGEYVYPAGWPASRALASDCTLKEKGGGLRFLEGRPYEPGDARRRYLRGGR